MSDYPSIKDPKFYNKLTSKFIKYKIQDQKQNMKEICFPKKFNLQIPQKFLAQYINPDSPYKSVLIFHRIGAGKTCTAVNIGEAWKQFRKVIVVVPASLIGNFRDELRSQCAGNAYLTDQERQILKSSHPTSIEYKNIIASSNKKIDKYYTIYSYNKFVEIAEQGKLNLNNSVLMVDEIQNMVSDFGKYYQVLHQTIHDAPPSLRVVLLSATPMFDRPVEIALTLNLLRLPKDIPISTSFEKMFIKSSKVNGKYKYNTVNLDKFKEMIKGYVSYFRGAPPYVFPTSIIKYVKCPMSSFQYKSYLTVLSNEDKEKQFEKLKNHKIFQDGDIIHLPNNFFIGTRIISNIAFPNKNINEDGMMSLTPNTIYGEKLQIYSPKFYRIIKKLNRCSGTAFVYSNFKEYGGIKSFVKILDAYGYKNYLEAGEGKKRYAIWTGDEKHSIKEEIKKVFNRKENSDGSKLKIMLGSPSIKEGVSLLRVQQVHIIEPYWNQSRLDQVIGRAIRYCSHKDVEKEKRIVKVYIYIATHEKESETIDQYIYKLAATKNKLIKEFEKALKESAIDCKLFKNANVYKGEDDLICA
jgi:superfamily II DNA or RNA helicase